MSKPTGKKGRVARPEEVLEQSDNWTDEQIVCRIRNHRFTVHRNAVHNTRFGYIYLALYCAGECGVFLEQELDPRTGRVRWSTINYREAKGYLSQHGRVIREAKDALRLRYVQRVIAPPTTRANETPHKDRSA